MKQYQVLTYSKKTGEFSDSILGGPVPYENCYISVYPSVYAGCKAISDLAVGEETSVEYRLCGGRTEAKIRRVE